MSETHASVAPLSATIVFSVAILLFLSVGLWAGRQKTETTSDYLLAGRNVPPALAALSSIATGNSGFMFIGLIGFTYETGLAAMWLSIGYLLGEVMAWATIHRQLRAHSEELNVETVAEYLGHDQQQGRSIRAAAALLTLIFLSIYAAAQFQAGGKALNVLFGWDISLGVIFGAIVAALYSITGGIRASIWVGSVQSVLMLSSVVLLAVVAVMVIGGAQPLWQQLQAIDPSLTHWYPSTARFGFLPFAIAWTVSGFGVIGQPHIMVRMMTIDSAEQVSRARNLYLCLTALLGFGATVIGLAARVLLPTLGQLDAELALPELTLSLLPGIGVGFILVGLFSATISTADAQVLSCSAALTQDLWPKAGASSARVRWGTVAMLLLVLAIALVSPDDVFALVTAAWAALASGLGPVMALRALQRPIQPAVAIAMMLTGVATVLVWRLGLHLSDDVYDVLPGMLVSVLTYLLLQPWFTNPLNTTPLVSEGDRLVDEAP